jgi:predicted RNA-binding Zn-ribbon protein involved in translation (DUF1610 family)
MGNDRKASCALCEKIMSKFEEPHFFIKDGREVRAHHRCWGLHVDILEADTALPKVRRSTSFFSCPYCNAGKTIITQGWAHVNQMQRRRQCPECGLKFSTEERLCL